MGIPGSITGKPPVTHSKAPQPANPAQVTEPPRINGRDIYEVANQLGGYVDESTPDKLAQFLTRESKAAADLADEIVRLTAAIGAGGQAVAVGYVTPEAIAEVSEGRIGNHLFPKGTLRPENEIPVYTHPAPSGQAVDEISSYEWLAQEFDRLAILRKMWTADEVAATIRRHDIERSDIAHPADERVVEALPLDEIRRRVRNIWGAISSNQVIDKDVEGQAKRLLADIDASLSAKEGR